MRKVLLGLLSICLLIGFSAGSGQTDVNVGATIGNDGIKSFYLAIGEHFKAPEKEIIFVRERDIPDEELPVIFFLARRSGIAPSVLVRLRLGGRSWMEIATRCGLTAEVFYVPVKSNPGPPYGKAYGHFKKRHRKDWGTIRLSDTDIVNFVNLMFISEHYGYSVDEIIRMREKGTGFITINAEVKKNKKKARDNSTKMASTKEFEIENNGKSKDSGKKKK